MPPPAPSQLHSSDPRFEPPAHTTAMVDGFNFFDAEFTVISRVTTCNDLWPFGPRIGRIHGVNVGHKPEVDPTTGRSYASPSQLLTGTVHVRFNSTESRDFFLDYFSKHKGMHYDRVLRARMPAQEMQPRCSFNASYDQRRFGSCELGEVM